MTLGGTVIEVFLLIVKVVPQNTLVLPPNVSTTLLSAEQTKGIACGSMPALSWILVIYTHSVGTYDLLATVACLQDQVRHPPKTTGKRFENIILTIA
eukprot:3342897-Amphidinium_carterae.1